MTLNEEAEFGDEGDDEGASKGKSAAVALKPIRHDHRAQASSSVAGNASSTVANKAPSKKRESKFFYRTMSQLLVRRL